MATALAVVGGVAGIAASGASIAASAGAFGGGGGGGGGGSAVNPISPFLFALLGVKVRPTSSGTVKIEPIRPKFQRILDQAFENGIFDRGLIDDVRDFLDPLPLDQAEIAAREIFNLVPGALQQALLTFDEDILPGATELAQTGFRTDVGPIADLAQRQFERETVPFLREQFAGQTGTFSTDFLNSVANEGADIQVELGALQTQLDEAAASRRAAGLPLLSQLAATRLGLPISVGNDLLAAGEQFRRVDEALRPGGRALDILGILSAQGAPSNLGFVGSQGAPSQTGQLLQGLSTALPGLASGFGQIAGAFGGGGGGGSSFGLNSQPLTNFGGLAPLLGGQ